MFAIDREKYFQILETQGLSAALTELHRDQAEFEFETFETQGGYSPEKWRLMNEARALSRELWLRVQAPKVPHSS
jgi:hypothetical protein